ncbi:hypothetical protein F4811DRAFT_551972 [Daldinia bambusicola]|nr:hypothetical protein F4811DRAFT_551972 [Daldinia bambusicola]
MYTTKAKCVTQLRLEVPHLYVNKAAFQTLVSLRNHGPEVWFEPATFVVQKHCASSEMTDMNNSTAIGIIVMILVPILAILICFGYSLTEKFALLMYRAREHQRRAQERRRAAREERRERQERQERESSTDAAVAV